jgi:hypothetical protein
VLPAGDRRDQSIRVGGFFAHTDNKSPYRCCCPLAAGSVGELLSDSDNNSPVGLCIRPRPDPTRAPA